MAHFCRYCGSPLREGANFCPKCGKSLVKTTAPKAPEQAPPAVERELHLNERVPNRPQAVQRPAADVQPQQTNPQTRRPSNQRLHSAPPVAAPISPGKAQTGAAVHSTRGHQAAERAQAALADQVRTLTASAAGELDCGEVFLDGPGTLYKAAEQALSPLSGVLQGLGSYVGGILHIFKRPVSLIGTVLLAALWFALAKLRGSDFEIVKILSWLTFSEGGFERSLPGMVCGTLGKGTVAAALVSLLGGGFVNAFKGIGALFTGHGEKRSLVSILLGALIGAAVYFAFAGRYASAETAMAGVAGALLSLEALGGGSGKLYQLSQSLTSRAADGVRTAVRGSCDGLLTGLTLGFALATALSALGVLEGLL